ncbi:MAG: 50S ribosomal protein L11 methyltransferase [Bacteroidota bacterium]
MKQKRWIQVRLSIPLSHQDLIVGQLSLVGFEGFVQEDASLDCFVPKAKWNARFLSGLRETLLRFQREFPNIETRFHQRVVKNQNWNARWERSIGIVEASSRIIIKPSWKKLRAKDKGKIVLTIDPKMSFGTGHHESTRLCLSLLEEHVRPDMRVLDFGSGTGVLSLAAVKLGARSAVAIDIDEWALENARENVKKNRVEKKVAVHQGGLERIPKNRFDLIVANIDLPTLTSTLRRLLLSLKPDGAMILSGLLTADLSSFMDVLSHRGAVPLEIISENEWAALVLVKVRAH